MNPKYDIVQFVIDDLRRWFPDFLDAKIHNLEGGKFDPPDIYVENLDIGIEVVTYIRGQDEEGKRGAKIVRQYTRREDITLSAGEKYSTKSTVPIWVSIYWLEHVSLPDGMVDKFAKVLCDLVLRYIPEHSAETIVIEWDDFAEIEVTRGIKLSSYLGSIDVYRFEGESESHWTCPEAGWVSVSAQELIPLVRSKEKKREQGWKKDCKEEWLIILASAGKHMPFIGRPSKVVTQPLEPGCIISSFGRVYWLDFNNRHAHNPFILLTHVLS